MKGQKEEQNCALFIYLFWSCWIFTAEWASLSAESRGYSNCGPRAPHRSGFWLQGAGPRACGLQHCGAWPHVLRGRWDPSIPGTELVSPALEGRSLSTVPPGRSEIVHFFMLREFLFVFLHSPRQTSALKPPFLFWSKLSHFSRIFLRRGLW